jgi:beta-glucanase (GH16 family)
VFDIEAGRVALRRFTPNFAAAGDESGRTRWAQSARRVRDNRCSSAGCAHGARASPQQGRTRRSFPARLVFGVFTGRPGESREELSNGNGTTLSFIGIIFLAGAVAADHRWVITWQDEFDGQALDSSKWTHDVGGGGWGNNELQYYTARPANTQVNDGMLAIRAVKESYTGPDNVTRAYTSARLVTKGKFSQLYGRFEARIRVPAGQGIWPAFWMLGEGFPAEPWPQCGEIDIMEHIGRQPSLVHGTVHGPGYSGAKGIGGSHRLRSGRKLSDGFHVFAVEWEPGRIRWFIDDTQYFTVTPEDLPEGADWVFDRPFHMLLNLAVGGNWPGDPDASTIFPRTMLVDYVRVYRREE